MTDNLYDKINDHKSTVSNYDLMGDMKSCESRKTAREREREREGCSYREEKTISGANRLLMMPPATETKKQRGKTG